MSSKKHLTLLHRRGEQIGVHNVNVNDVHKDSLSLNDRIARRVSHIVGTMWFCYGLSGVMFVWALLQQSMLPMLHLPVFDPYPFAFLFFCLGGIMQSLLMPLIMTAQNQDARHAELRAEADYHVNQASFDQLTVILEHVARQTELIQQQDSKMAQLLQPKPTTRKKATVSE